MTTSDERPNLWRELLHGGEKRPRLMAILNVSPESFYKGSVSSGPQAIRDACERLAEAGADMIDIGAMSTAPYKETQISAEEESLRMHEAVNAARQACNLPLSADTLRADVARVALDAGADAVNDVTGLHGDPAMGPLIAERACGVILMANACQLGESTADEEPVTATLDCLSRCLQLADDAGIQRGMVCLDPGIGFFRGRLTPWHAWDMALLRGLKEFSRFGLPLAVSASRKSFIGHLLNRPDPNDRLAGSLLAAVHAARLGARLIRTHDVAQTRDALRMAELFEE